MGGVAMTTAEHQLIIEMFKEQRLLYSGLVAILNSRDVLDRADLEAFDALVSASSRPALEENIKAEYLAHAKTLGVTIDESALI